tara:strand:- start:122 stop:436 length:315 start_codon:yes stop_codon:yes gene_type:complete
MVLFPKHVFKHICRYCDDRIEKRQKRLWNKIIPNRRLTFSLTKPIFITIWVQDKIKADTDTDTGIIRSCIVMWNWNIVSHSFIPFSLYTKLDDNINELYRLGIV